MWKPFFIEDICEINSGKDIYERERIDGATPYITATANNNGIGYFVSNDNNTRSKNCISVNRNGSVGYAFYHPYEVLYGNDTRRLEPKVRNGSVAQFFAKAISDQKDKYGYGYKMGIGRLKRQKVLLPTDENAYVNFSYMEKYMKSLEMKKQVQILDYLIKHIT